MKNTLTESKRGGEKMSGWTTGFPDKKKQGKNEGYPVLVFDNKPDSANTLDLLTIPEVAKVLKISVCGVRRLKEGRHIPFFKVGGSIRFSKADLVSYLERQRVEALG